MTTRNDNDDDVDDQTANATTPLNNDNDIDGVYKWEC